MQSAYVTFCTGVQIPMLPLGGVLLFMKLVLEGMMTVSNYYWSMVQTPTNAVMMGGLLYTYVR
ncbi:unnamed protein product [Staurois parvus]|uniref:Uncharacterized protein n=1 Tax=Staurois parvus TaxID=386267 RepID=A0ABN9G2W0_9NEOB|nr:unnamed protein product [Staurois parvus]